MRKQTKLVAVLSAAALLAIGASITSFAATKGWVQEGEDWVYLDSDGNREANVWRRSGDNYYWLDDEGLMARNVLVKDDTVDATYYVDENGVRVVNAWKELPNDDGAQVGSENTDDTPSVLYYYFGSAGKAYKAGDEKKVREIDGKYYMFNEEGQMLSGWQTSTKGDIYYLGTETEGWAYTKWQHLEPSDALNGEDYDDLEWFYFKSGNGKAYKGETKYIDGRYYHFDENGILDDDWYNNASTVPTAASGAQAFADVNGSKSGWVYSGDADIDEDSRYDNDDMYWYYLVNVNGGGKTARSIPYNYQVAAAKNDITGDGSYVRAMIIKNKTYLFNGNGKMIKGFVVIKNSSENAKIKDNNDTVKYVWDSANGMRKDSESGELVAYNVIAGTEDAYECKVVENFAGADKPFGYAYKDGEIDKDGDKKIGQPVAGGRTLVNGLYYFSEAGGSLDGQMQTGRTAITKDGETFYYYFSKNTTFPGYAYTNTIKDGYLYGNDGKCVTADSGNSYSVYELPETIRVENKTTPATVEKGKRVIISRTGKVKTSGSVTIDGVKYTIDSKTYTCDDGKYID